MASNLKVKKAGAWVAIPDGKYSVKTGGIWKGPQKVWIKRSGVWVDTGFVGKPLVAGLVIYSESYSSLYVTVTAPSSGAVVSTLRIALMNSGGGVLTQYDYGATPGSAVNVGFTGLTADTNYILRAWAISTAGVLSDPVSIQRRTGHPEQGYNQANYGWGAVSNAVRPTQIDGTSEYLPAGTYPGANAVDNNWGTLWVSGANSVPSAYAALVFQTMGGNRLLSSIGASVQTTTDSMNQQSYCGIWINGSLVYNVGPLGSDWGQHRAWNVESYGYNLQNVTKFNISNTNLVPWPLAYRAELVEVYYYYRDWVVVSYTWIVTVNYAANSYW